MTTALVIGSGAAAVGAVLALSSRADMKIIVVDIGLQLEAERKQLVATLADTSPSEWNAQAVESISKQPVSSRNLSIPEKRVFGSDYPFRDAGQVTGLSAFGDATASLISSAYGGFSNVWGSQIMPFTSEAFEDWPVTSSVMRSHYEAILREIPFAGEEDDLANIFPLMRPPSPLPELSARSLRVLQAYEKNRSKINSLGITAGKARLALNARKCVRCKMCMTGCPYGLIYSAAQTFDMLRLTNRVTFHTGLLALKIVEEADKACVIVKDIATCSVHRIKADRIYVACGAIGTTRLVSNSLGIFDTALHMLESRQFIIPLLSARAIKDPRQIKDFTLNQFNMVVAPTSDSVDISTLHFYTFNPAFIDGLPSVFRKKSLERIQVELLRRLTVAFGYLPSWNSPRLRINIGTPSKESALPDFRISSEAAPPGQNQMLRAVMLRLARSARLLDLYPVIPMLRLSAGGKSYHWGGSFPHSRSVSTIYSSDSLGRVGSWDRIHLVDASVFPSIPAMTYGLTVMANAHRIASESMELV